VFVQLGPRDTSGRSLRELDLQHRLFRCRCSYQIYTPAFDALPSSALAAVHDRLWQVLSGAVTQRSHRALPQPSEERLLKFFARRSRGCRLSSASTTSADSRITDDLTRHF
jgi:hypothetical protein